MSRANGINNDCFVGLFGAASHCTNTTNYTNIFIIGNIHISTNIDLIINILYYMKFEYEI